MKKVKWCSLCQEGVEVLRGRLHYRQEVAQWTTGGGGQLPMKPAFALLFGGGQPLLNGKGRQDMWRFAYPADDYSLWRMLIELEEGKKRSRRHLIPVKKTVRRRTKKGKIIAYTTTVHVDPAKALARRGRLKRQAIQATALPAWRMLLGDKVGQDPEAYREFRETLTSFLFPKWAGSPIQRMLHPHGGIRADAFEEAWNLRFGPGEEWRFWETLRDMPSQWGHSPLLPDQVALVNSTGGMRGAVIGEALQDWVKNVSRIGPYLSRQAGADRADRLVFVASSAKEGPHVFLHPLAALLLKIEGSEGREEAKDWADWLASRGKYSDLVSRGKQEVKRSYWAALLPIVMHPSEKGQVGLTALKLAKDGIVAFKEPHPVLERWVRQGWARRVPEGIEVSARKSGEARVAYVVPEAIRNTLRKFIAEALVLLEKEEQRT